MKKLACRILRSKSLLVLLCYFVVAVCFPVGQVRAESDFGNPDVVTSINSELHVTLNVDFADSVIGTDRVHLRNYNGKLVGPTLRVRPGDTLNIHINNKLPVDKVKDKESFNVTNLHTHGLHVSPAGNSDNVLLEIQPGTSFDSEINIPNNHPPGTFWYHPHVHGSTSIQVGSGMSGALIIEGGLDEVPAIKTAKDYVFVLQQIQYDEKGEVNDVTKYTPDSWGKSGRKTTINGMVEPIIHMNPGEVQRWRLIHSGVRETIAVSLDGLVLHEIANDGIAFGRIDLAEEIILQPGYRSDVLVKAKEPGIYLLMDRETPKEVSLFPQKEHSVVLAKVVVAGSRKDMRLPTNEELAPLAPYKTITDDEVDFEGRGLIHQTVTLDIDFGNGRPVEWRIDGRLFKHDMEPRRLKLGKVEEWHIFSSFFNHPFHIHINPFEVITKGPTGKRKTVWKDTILVRAGDPPTIFRTRYEKYIGKFVIHCHILDHQDRGMMQLIEIEP